VRAFEQEWLHNEKILPRLIDYSIAHLVMLSERAVVAPAIAGRIVACLEAIGRDGFAGLPYRPELDGLQPNLEAEVTRRLGADVGGWLSTGRARQECELVARQICVRDDLLRAMSAAADVAEALVELAGRAGDAVMPYHTWAQHAEPITFGYFAAAEAFAIEADLQRLQGAFARIDMSRADIGQIVPPPLPIDRGRVAELLGFGGVMDNSLHAYGSLDAEIGVISALALHAARLARLAETLFVWASPEFGFLAFGPEFTGTSYAMPQKRNPYALRLARPVAARAIGAWNDAMQLFSGGLSLVGNGVVHVPNRALTLIGEVADLDRLMADALPTLTLDRARMSSAAEQSLAFAPQLVFLLVRSANVSFRQAHEVVARLLEQGETYEPERLERVFADVVGRPLAIDGDAVQTGLDVRAVIASRDVGGPAPAAVASQAEILRERLTGFRHWLDGRNDMVSRAAAELAAAAAGLSAAAPQP